MAYVSRAGRSLPPCINSSLSSSSQPCSLCSSLLPSPQWHTGTTSPQKSQPTFASACCPDPTPVHSDESTELMVQFPVHPKAASRWLAVVAPSLAVLPVGRHLPCGLQGERQCEGRATLLGHSAKVHPVEVLEEPFLVTQPQSGFSQNPL